MLQTFINIVHVFVCMVLVGVVLLQQGKGGGMGAAFGGATTQVFGGRGAGNILTRATAICAAIFMLTSVSLAYLSSSGDRALKAKVAQEAGRKKDKGELKERSKDSDATPAPTTTDSAPPEGAPVAPTTTESEPAPASTESAPAPANTETAPAAPANTGTTTPPANTGTATPPANTTATPPANTATATPPANTATAAPPANTTATPPANTTATPPATTETAPAP